MPKTDNILFASATDFSEHISKYIGETEKNFVLADTNTAKHCYPLLMEALPYFDDDNLIIIDDGDEEKNITNLHHTCMLLEAY